MRVCISALLFLCILGTNAQTTFDSGYRGGKIDSLYKKAGTMDFLVVGDWGRSGEYMQKDVAVQMGRAAHQLEADFIVSTGDNIYPNGVASVYDPLWKRNFEDIYTSFSLMTDWYPVLGNHDYGGNVQAEIDYSSISRRWRLPSRYYSMEKKSDDGVTVLLVFLDTSPFEKSYYSSKDDLFRSNINSQDTTEQKRWLLQTLKSSKADWKIVFGHHPFYSAGKRKERTVDVAASLRPILESGGANIYIAGHEHHLQHDQLTPSLSHFISGAGSEITPVTGNTLTRFVAATHGFMTVSINKAGADFRFIDHVGKVIYTTSISPLKN